MVCQAATFEERDVSKWAQTYLKDAALMVGSFARLAEFDTSKASSYTRVIGPLGLSTKPGRDQRPSGLRSHISPWYSIRGLRNVYGTGDESRRQDHHL